MRPHYVPLRPMALVFLLAIFLSGFLNPGESKAKDFNPDNPLNPPAPIFWCPGKTQDQQITAKHKTGCQPLYDKQSEELFRSNALKQGYELPDRPPIKIVELQSAATEFSNRYRNFLSCCLMSEDALREVILLIDSANHILKAVQQKGVYNSAGFGIGSNQDGSPGSGPGTGAGNSGLGGGPGEAPKLGTIARQFTLSQIVGTVARAREDLVGLNRRLRKMHDAQQNINELNDEASARVRLQVQEEEEAIRREFGSKKPPASAPTGMDIQDTTLKSKIGGDIEETTLNANFGADIGALVSPYSNVNESLRPRRGDNVHDSDIPYRPGDDLQDSALPSSTGFEIDNAQNRDGASTVQRRGVGPSIGDSNLNNQRR